MHDEPEKDSVPTETDTDKAANAAGATDAPETAASSKAEVQPEDVTAESSEIREPDPTADDGVTSTDPPAQVVEESDAVPEAEAGSAASPPPEFTIESLSAALEDARKQLVTLSRESERSAATLQDTQARLRAVSKAYRDQQEEMEGFRKRLETQSRYKLDRQAFDAVAAFLDPVQNLRRSMENAEGLPDALLQGLQMVESQFSDAMTRLGLEPVPGVGTIFDPNMHEALAVAPVTDAEQDGKVLIVHAEGFMVAGKILEASKVVIGKYTAEALEEA